MPAPSQRSSCRSSRHLERAAPAPRSLHATPRACGDDVAPLARSAALGRFVVAASARACGDDVAPLARSAALGRFVVAASAHTCGEDVAPLARSAALRRFDTHAATRRHRGGVVAAAVAFALAVVACRGRESPVASSVVREPDRGGSATSSVPASSGQASPHKRQLLALYELEEHRRATLDIAALPPSDVALGPDPYRVARVRDGWVGILRGESAIVALDERGAEVARAAAPRSPSGLAVAPDGDVVVVGEGSRDLARYRVTDGRIARVATVAVGALGMRDVAIDGARTYIVEEREGRLLELDGRAVRELGRCHGPIAVLAHAGVVATNCLLDHAIEIRRGGELIRIHHDGPMWSLALHRAPDGSLLIATGGVEDHALVRDDGGFGYIDSFLFVYRLAPGATHAERLVALNLSELGLVTPKWLAFRARTGVGSGTDVTITAAGYATAGMLALTWLGGDFASPPSVARTPAPPGIAAVALADDGTWLAADPLLDAWIVGRPSGTSGTSGTSGSSGSSTRVVPVASQRPPRAMLSRVGELLFFTTAMAPWSSTDGALSRFSCETCHHEGYVDGRVHFTGRDDVHATTRPLLGLFNNRPYFSRALDDSMTQMVHSEFRVANRHNGRDPWFALARGEVPGLAELGAPASLAPEQLREALMAFLIDFTPRANPAVLDRAQSGERAGARFDDRERAGAAVFRDRCASCHAARLISDEPRSAVPFERWEALVLAPAGALVWSDAAYARTGVEPYVHPKGTRVPSLRRLYKKWPYFTNGSARSLVDLVARFASTPGATYHDHAPAGAAHLAPRDAAALLAFLDLL